MSDSARHDFAHTERFRTLNIKRNEITTASPIACSWKGIGRFLGKDWLATDAPDDEDEGVSRYVENLP